MGGGRGLAHSPGKACGSARGDPREPVSARFAFLDAFSAKAARGRPHVGPGRRASGGSSENGGRGGRGGWGALPSWIVDLVKN